MKILYTGFKGKNNASCQLIELIDPSDKILLTNSFEGIKRDLDNISLELYDLIIMFGINKKLKDKLIIEVNSCLNLEYLSTKVNYEQLKMEIHDNDINVDLNFEPTIFILSKITFLNSLFPAIIFSSTISLNNLSFI